MSLNPEIRDLSEIANREGGVFFTVRTCRIHPLISPPRYLVPHTAVCNIYAIGHQLPQSHNLSDEEKKKRGKRLATFSVLFPLSSTRFPPHGSEEEWWWWWWREDWKASTLFSVFFWPPPVWWICPTGIVPHRALIACIQPF